MKIVIVNEYFSEKMGYSDFFLCKSLAGIGHEVHLISSDMHPAFKDYDKIYAPFLGPKLQSCGKKNIHNFMLHRLPHAYFRKSFYIKGIVKYINELNPDVVQSIGTINLTTLMLAAAKPFHKWKLFYENHIHASVFPPARTTLPVLKKLKWSAFKLTVGSLLNFSGNACFSISTDSARISKDFFGIYDRNIVVYSLASDPDIFHPANTDSEQIERDSIRHKWGAAPDDIVCIYSGRFSKDKNPLCLSKAVDSLNRKNKNYKAVFIGAGTDEQIAEIKAHSGSVIHPFVPALDLPPLYRAADIGVWPKQESTSQLDAIASGLPLILSNKVETAERHEGNGFTYLEDNPESLEDALLKLEDKNIRSEMSIIGIQKIKDKYNWHNIALDRISRYEKVLKNRVGA